MCVCLCVHASFFFFLFGMSRLQKKMVPTLLFFSRRDQARTHCELADSNACDSSSMAGVVRLNRQPAQPRDEPLQLTCARVRACARFYGARVSCSICSQCFFKLFI